MAGGLARMNVKIKDGAFQFKITEEELNTLLNGQCIHMEVKVMDKALVVTINPRSRESIVTSKLVVDDGDVYLNLLLPPLKIQELSDMGRSRAGLEQQVGDLSATLQVDLRADSRKAAAR
jgi:hypothetical protein